MRTYAPAATETVLDRLLEEPSLAAAVKHHARLPEREAITAPFPPWLDPRIVRGLEDRGITSLYSHQAEAVEAVHAGEDVVVVTPTASGKTLCYALPVLQALAEDPSARALFLFPTKALGQDQVAEFAELARASSLAGRGGDVRRRHAGADPVGHPHGRAGRGHEPGHAPLRDPPASHEVVPALRAGPGHRHRRAAHLPRRVRQPRRERPAPAAPAVRPLRLEPDHRVLVRDDRESRPSSRRSSPVARRGSSIATARRPARSTSCSSIRRCSTRRPGARARRSPTPSAGRCRSSGRAARRSCSGGRGSRSRSS